jgi:hypothetical protein
MSNKIHNVYFKLADDQYRVFNPVIKEFTTMKYEDFKKLSMKYEMFDGYEATDEGLYTFYKDFDVWNKQLKAHYDEHKSHLTFFYFKYTNEMNVIETFYNYSKNMFDIKYNNYSAIKSRESSYFERCNNGGLMFSDSGIYDCIGYDYNSFFPRLLGDDDFDLKIPIESGKEFKLDTLDYNNIEFGFYNVKIECEDKRFFFNYSKDDVYTHYSLLDAIKYKERFNIKITLNMNCEYNAYLYCDKYFLKETKKIFGKWFNELNAFKIKHPKNKLIKHLMSSLWGALSKKNVIYVKEDEAEKYDFEFTGDAGKEYRVISCSNSSTNPYFTMIKQDDPYKYNIRLKPFLLSYSRSIMLDIAMKNHPQEIVRIMVDNIVYKSDVKFDVQNMSLEKKTSGLINVKNVLKLVFLCKFCKCEIDKGCEYCYDCSNPEGH